MLRQQIGRKGINIGVRFKETYISHLTSLRHRVIFRTINGVKNPVPLNFKKRVSRDVKPFSLFQRILRKSPERPNHYLTTTYLTRIL